MERRIELSLLTFITNRNMKLSSILFYRTKHRYFVLFLLSMHGIIAVHAQGIATKEAAFKMYFADAAIERKTVFLTDDQVKAIQNESKAKVESKLLPYYVARRHGKIIGYAFIETRIMRTMPATFMIVFKPDRIIRAVELLAFTEPDDYKPSERWFAQFKDRAASSGLWFKRDIQNISGATISAQAITDAVRRVAATFKLAIPMEADK